MPILGGEMNQNQLTDQPKEIAEICVDEFWQKVDAFAVEVAKEVTDIEVTDEKSYEACSELLSRLARAKKGFTKVRDTFIKPGKVRLKRAEEFIKAHEEPVTIARALAKGMMESFIDERDRKTAAAEAKALEEHDKETKTARNLGMAKPDAPMAAPVPEKTVRTIEGSSSAGKRWTFEVVDFTKVADGWKKIDDPVVNSAIRNGMREAPGLKIFQKTVISSR